MAELYDYINRSKNLKDLDGAKHAKIALLSSFTINGLAETLKVLCHDAGIKTQHYVAPYGQYAQQVIDKSSDLYSFQPDIIFMLIDSRYILRELTEFPYRLTDEQRSESTNQKFDEFSVLLNTLRQHTNARIVVNSLLVPQYTSMGILEGKIRHGIRKCVAVFNDKLEDFAKNDLGMFIFDMNSWRAKHGDQAIFDHKLFYIGDMLLSPKGIIEIAKEYMEYMYPLMSMSRKCIVLDLDNTLWGGIVGEDGPSGIKLGPEKEGLPYLEFQKRLLALNERGIILAINSRNNPLDAMDVIKNHKYMALREQNFASIRINWQDKATNIKEIADELKIGLDSIVFIDDDRTNRELVKSLIPEVLVVELPESPCYFSQAIEQLNVFGTFAATHEDAKRSQMYFAERKRNEMMASAPDIESFIKQLEIRCVIEPANSRNTSRIAQLTQKTNQFNLTTRRYTESDIERMTHAQDHAVFCIQVSDRLGDYGITGAAIIKIKRDNIFEIDTFLMSCRILGKRIEFSFMQYIIDAAIGKGAKKIIGSFIPTSKNMPAKDFLEDCGFKPTRVNGNVHEYELVLAEYHKIGKFVEVASWKA